MGDLCARVSWCSSENDAYRQQDWLGWRWPNGARCAALQKDPHTLYLEQELESLKVVLDIKNKQLHQQERKLMQMDKLVRQDATADPPPPPCPLLCRAAC